MQVPLINLSRCPKRGWGTGSSNVGTVTGPTTSCTVYAQLLAEPLPGTAPYAGTWLAIEQPGPWGAKALTDSRLDPEFGGALERWAEGTGVKVVLVRRPGRDSDAATDRGGPDVARTVLLSHVAPNGGWLRTAVLDDLAPLLTLDPKRLAAGEQPAARFGFTAQSGPNDVAALVCTNGRRDVCCAVRGRPLAAGLAERHPGQVWESTHLGGHRFSPTAVFLPTGAVHGHLDLELAERIWSATERRQLLTERLRGHSWYDRVSQVADAAIRASIHATALSDLTVGDASPVSPDSWDVEVSHVDGRRWVVRVAVAPAGTPRPESCGKLPATPLIHQVVSVTPC